MSTRIVRRRPRAALLLGAVLAALTVAAPTAASATGALPAGCTHESRLWTGAVDPKGLCVSLGYGVRPAGSSGPATKNVLTSAEGKVPMPFDFYVRSDVAQGFADGTGRLRAAYLLLFGGAFMCNSRADLAWQARALARRGYVAIVPEYPLAGALSAYGHYKPNPGYSQTQVTTPGANACELDDLKGTPGFEAFAAKLRSRGFEPALQQGQWVVQTLIRKLKTDRSYGVDPKRIFALGSSAGGSLAIRLALGGDDDRTPSGADQGDSTIAGAVSISGPACFPGSVRMTQPLLEGVLIPSRMAPCRMALTSADPPVVMIQEPHGGVDDPVVPSAFMAAGCDAMNAAGLGRRCIYEDRSPLTGGYIYDGQHAKLSETDWNRLFDSLAQQGVGPA